jgi:tellurite resistance protein TehA-like permease
MKDHLGLLGTITTLTGGIVSWLPVINEVVQIFAGLIAITVGIATLRHYFKKDK